MVVSMSASINPSRVCALSSEQWGGAGISATSGGGSVIAALCKVRRADVTRPVYCLHSRYPTWLIETHPYRQGHLQFTAVPCSTALLTAGAGARTDQSPDTVMMMRSQW